MLNKNPDNYLIFTDLDGTLLDHHTYSFKAATQMLSFIKQNEIALIIVTSKTKEEILQLRQTLDIDYPFIVENGAGIFLPQNDSFEQITMGKTYEETLHFLDNFKEQFGIKGFNEMSHEEVATLTGLDLNNAQMAKQRDFTEPFIIEDENNIAFFRKECLKEGFDVIRGGRFYHLITKGQDKANAIEALKNIYEEVSLKEYTTIALGDGANDKTMLGCVDIPILIKQYDGRYIDFDKEGLIKTQQIGPKGWNEALKELLCP